MTTPHRTAIDRLPAYTLADRSAPEGVRIIQLGQNELGIAPSPRVMEAAERALTELNRYPEVDHGDLRHAIAERQGLDPGRILCGAGSMELMGLLATVYIEPGNEVVVSQFGYKFFQIQCAVAGASIAVVPEPEMQVDIEALAAAVTPRTRLVYVVNPGNPTGEKLAPGALRRLRDMLPEAVMLIVDGAYGDFVTDPDFETGFDMVEAGENTVVLRTFSKAYGLAALRVGWCYASPVVLDTIAKVRVPNTITQSGLAAAQAAIEDVGHVERVVAEVVALREAFRQKVLSHGFSALASGANFVLMGCPQDAPIGAGDLYRGLKRRGIIVRPMLSYGLADHLRVTIGSREEMDIVRDALEEIVRDA